MAKNIVYFGEQSLFSETVKNMATLEGFNFYDYSAWEECSGQFLDLDPSYVFVDLDSFDPATLGDQAETVEAVFFKSQHDEELSWNSKYHFQDKPLDILKFRNFLQELING